MQPTWPVLLSVICSLLLSNLYSSRCMRAQRQLLCGLSRKQGSSPVYWVYFLPLLPFNEASSAAKFEKQCASCGPLARRCILYIFGIHLCIHVYHFFERSLAKCAFIWSKIILWNTILQITIAAFFFNVLTSNLFLWCKAEFSASLLQVSGSHDPSEIILICCSRNTSYYYQCCKQLCFYGNHGKLFRNLWWWM